MDDEGDVPPRQVAHQVPHRHRDVAARGAEPRHQASDSSANPGRAVLGLGEGGDVGNVEGSAHAGHGRVHGGGGGPEDGDDTAEVQGKCSELPIFLLVNRTVPDTEDNFVNESHTHLYVISTQAFK